MTKEIKDWLKTALTGAVDKLNEDIIRQLIEDKGLNLHIIICDNNKDSVICTTGMTGAVRRNLMTIGNGKKN